MPTIRSSGDIIASISSELADNNAGLISAYDVRHNMEDTVASISRIVASGDTQTEYPFYNNVTIRHIPGDTNGILYVESGVMFPNSDENPTLLQRDPYPGNNSIDHGQLDASSLLDDDHPQYINLNGVRAMNANFGVGNENWINSSGLENGSSEDRGIQFVHQGDHDDMYIGTSGKLEFNLDNSRIDSFHGVAKAWVSFSGGAPPSVDAYYNVSGIQRMSQGTYKITFNSGILDNNNYVAIANSNGLGDNINEASMQPNTVGLLRREGDDGTSLRSIYFRVEQDDGDLVDAAQNDLVVFGYDLGSSSGTPPTVA